MLSHVRNANVSRPRSDHATSFLIQFLMAVVKESNGDYDTVHSFQWTSWIIDHKRKILN